MPMFAFSAALVQGEKGQGRARIENGTRVACATRVPFLQACEEY
jgi:hypothetical protein